MRRPPTSALCLGLFLSAGLAAPSAAAPARRPAAATAPAPPPAPAGVVLSTPAAAALKARPIGPAIMGGRVSEIAVDPLDPATFYVGFATGGVWKTSDAGCTFAAMFDRRRGCSRSVRSPWPPPIAAVVWVGTGEANDRNSSGWGDGVYRSTDGGATWAKAGLADQPHDRADRRRSHGPGDGVRRGDGGPVGARRRARPLQDDRRRQELEAGPRGAGAGRCRDRLRRRRDRPAEPRHALRRALRAAAHALVVRRTAAARPTAGTSAGSSSRPTAARRGRG